MQIRAKLTLQFTIIVSLILILFSVAIYISSSEYRAEEFYVRLKDKAITSGKLFANVDEVDSNLLKIIDRNTANPLTQEEILIVGSDNRVKYQSSNKDFPTVPYDIVKLVRANKEYRFAVGNKDAFGILFKGKSGDLVVLASKYDLYGHRKLNFLFYLLIFGTSIVIGLTAIAGAFFSRQALSPISKVIDQVEDITETNLFLRVNEGNGSDEIAQLAIRFNKMLSRLEAAFELQRTFVANSSHELRTPLTAITGQLEVSLMNDKMDPEAREVISSVLDDIRNLNSLSNGLLDLAQASQDISEISIEPLRIDELLGQVQADLLKKKGYSVEISFTEFPEDEQMLTINGNAQLLKVAFTNVMENGCKYSPDHKVRVEVSFEKKFIKFAITDNGIGIPMDDLDKMFQPFFRSENAKKVKGHGIGLPLTQKIVLLHKGKIAISSELGKWTRVNITLPIIM